MSLRPLVRYQGGKRRVAGSIVEALDLDACRPYAEPFVGAGAVYVEARRRGWRGPAVLGDVNAGVVAAWTCLHDLELGAELVEQLADRATWPRTNEAYLAVAGAPPPERLPELAATWWWLSNAGFGGKPVSPAGDRWRHHGAAFDWHRARHGTLGPSAKGASPMLFGPMVDRAARLVAGLAGAPTEVHLADHRDLPIPAGAAVYLDPPYGNTTGYRAGEAPDVLRWAARLDVGGPVLVSWGELLDAPAWRCRELRARDGQSLDKLGGGGTRREVLLFRRW